uniref:CoA transferase n=1 Tax=Percolomonas cosmopolitus TaxID=63605 RepID=A0A7S1KRZ6_9EUKA
MPLSNLTILDLSRVLAGPFASQNLADLGATVLKVEHVDSGDDTRYWGPPFWEKCHSDQSKEIECSAYFATCNRSKKSIALDLKTDQGREIIYELAKKSHVLLENFSTGVTERLHIDYGTMHKLNPELVYASISGFGRTGEYKNRPGYDFLAQGASGMMHLTGEPDREPQKIGMALVDVLTGMYVTQGVLASLIAKKGQFIDVSLFDSALASLVNQAQNYLSTGKSPKRLGNEHPNIAPYELFECRDGPLIITVGNDHQFNKLAKFLGMDPLEVKDKFATNKLRLEHRPQLKDIIHTSFVQHDRAHWIKHLNDLGIPCGPVNNVAEAFAEQPAIDRDMVWSFKDSPVKVVGNPIKFSETKIDSRNATPPPRLGQHTHEILSGVLEYSDEQILALERKHVIRCDR